MLESSIQVASRLCGVGVHTLRAWEKRYGAVTPQRSDNGRRIYSEDDICKLQMLNQLCSYGNSISAIANYSNVELSKLLEKFNNKERVRPIVNEGVRDLVGENTLNALSHLLLAVDTFKLDVISHELSKQVRALNPQELALNVIVPLMREIKVRVNQGLLTSGQEMAILSIIKFHSSEILYSTFRQAARSNKVFVFYNSDNVTKELDVICCALICSYYRHRNFYFANNLSLDILCQTAEALDANYLVVDTRYVILNANQESVTQYLLKLVYKLKHDMRILLLGDVPMDVPMIDEFLRKNSQFKCISSVLQFDELVKTI
ncbi:MAG: MerR family transcriptional regulator [Bdellovibrio sp.]|nr:MerR family transcriptional regulator [Bdellovibrio sp.]